MNTRPASVREPDSKTRLCPHVPRALGWTSVLMAVEVVRHQVRPEDGEESHAGPPLVYARTGEPAAFG
jgi:hypothetical protein